MRFVFLLAGIALLAACGSTPPVHFYTLTPMAEEGKANAAQEAVSLGIGPLRFPDYLARSHIVRHRGRNRLDVAESRRWAEPLDAAFSRVLAENLSRELGGSRILRAPWPAWQEPALHLSLDVIRFDVNAQGEVELIVNWMLVRGREKTVLLVKRSRYRQPAGEDFDNLVMAHSRVLAQFAAELAEAVSRS